MNLSIVSKMCAWEESNPQPAVPKTDALSIELQAQANPFYLELIIAWKGLEKVKTRYLERVSTSGRGQKSARERIEFTLSAPG